jgi:hypothetical protein
LGAPAAQLPLFYKILVAGGPPRSRPSKQRLTYSVRRIFGSRNSFQPRQPDGGNMQFRILL